MQDRIIAIAIIGIMLGVLILIIQQPTSERIARLADVEVQNYEGEDLSSIADFRENSIKGPQFIDIGNYKLTVDGLVDSPKELSYSNVLEEDGYEKVATLYCVEGWDVKILWEGVLVSDLLKKASPKESANTVIFHAHDGYSTSLSLDYILNNNILLAYKINGEVLPPERGHPFQLVAEDKWGYKWIKWVTRIELSDEPGYRGYWERAGYNNDGDMDGPIFET